MGAQSRDTWDFSWRKCCAKRGGIRGNWLESPREPSLWWELVNLGDGGGSPRLWPTIFNTVDVAVIAKSELAVAVEFDEAAARRNIQAVRPGMEMFKLSAKSGEGMDEYLEFFESPRIRFCAAAAF
jgi:hypothetical protein